MLNPSGLDPYKPTQIAELVETAGVAKAKLPVVQLLTLSILAGAFIGLGAVAYTMVMTGADASFGPYRFLGGIVFSLGLILIIIGGAELFTGNALMIMASVDGLITPAELLRNWTLVYVGNFIGASALAIAVYFSGILDGPAGITAIAITDAKASLSATEAFVRVMSKTVCLCPRFTASFA